MLTGQSRGWHMDGLLPARERRRVAVDVSVFISYRRADVAGTAGRIADRLKVQLDGEVFIDEALEPGDTWRDELVTRVRAADVVLVIIGPRFAATALERSRTLGEDVVRLE